MEIKAVLFDLDGTLIDTEKIYQKIWPETIEHFGYHMTREQCLQLRSLGRPFAPLQFKEWYGDDFDYHEARAYRKILFEEIIARDGIGLKVGAREILEWLKERNIIIATATATDEERATRYLEKVGLLSYFDKICCATMVKEGKPKPDVYLYACEQVGVPKENCIAVEDAPNGVRSASSAGIKTIYIPDQNDDEEEVKGLYYRKLGSLLDLKNIIEN
ncbi:HAD family hydrolase [Butyrivibrio sp. VCD2006]|uniref:HAD family hydrolase n=1 Tax=Butyrivibrio sp. VCD2006 TaxID=1280664 RepID=UPI0004051C52|nr:HAD family phosphatase [Butyrivibrio sp. VCD2006]